MNRKGASSDLKINHMANQDHTPTRNGRRPRPRRPVYFYIPEIFDARRALPPELRRYADCANYLLHCIVMAHVRWETDAKGFARLKVEYLRKVIPDRHERRIRELLVARGVIECDPSYERGVQSRGYRLGQTYRAAFRRVECEDARVARRVARTGARHHRPIRFDVHRHLHGCYRNVRIDIAQAETIARGLNHPEIHLAAVDMIASGQVEFSYCAQGRVHTNVTRLARELRPALRVGGQPLWNVDVVNSQPLILGLVIRSYREAGGRLHLPGNPDRPANPYLPLPRHHIGNASSINTNTNTMSNRGLRNAEALVLAGVATREMMLGDDERRYVDLCEQGRIYEYLQEQSGLGGMSRDEIKEKFYREVFFGRNQVVTDLTRLFAAEFPNAMAVIRAVKRKDHRQLARLMQLYESSLVIDRVCRRLMNDHPDVPVVTIHDSLMTTPDRVDLVQTVMLDEYARVGLSPKLKVEQNTGQTTRRRAA
jgi:hypothetical protein